MPSSASIFRFPDQGSGQRSFFPPQYLNSIRISNTKIATILIVNVRSPGKNWFKLETFIHSLDVQPDVIYLTGTLFSETNESSNYLLFGYNSFLTKKRNSKQGGVMLQCNQFCNITTKSKIDFQEALCVAIPSRSNKVELVKTINKFLKNLSSSNQSVNIWGYMNLSIKKGNMLSRNYLNSITATGVCISSSEPTRSTTEYSSR